MLFPDPFEPMMTWAEGRNEIDLFRSYVRAYAKLARIDFKGNVA